MCGGDVVKGVTTLPAKAGSFSGHARRNRPRYVLTAQPKPFQRQREYISGGVDILIQHQTAVRAIVSSDMQFFSDNSTTTTTHLRRIVNELYHEKDKEASGIPHPVKTGCPLPQYLCSTNL